MSIFVSNIVDGDEVPTHLAFIEGKVVQIEGGRQVSVIRSTNLTDPNGATLSWTISEVNGTFKCLIQLNPGSNIVRLWTKIKEFTLNISLVLPLTSKYVRLLYVVPQDGDGTFQAPDGVNCSPCNAMDRFILAAKLLQTFTSENFHQHGFKRRTFRLETDKDFNPTCHLFRTKMTTSEARSLQGSLLWHRLKDELIGSNETSDIVNCKFVCLLSFTLYENPTKCWPEGHSEVLALTKGHTAVGGGGLAVFGTGCLHTWAESLDTFVGKLTDTTTVDRTRFMDDSGNRGTYGCCYATGLGAVMHELGHTWDLPHTPTGIMARGFDDFNKFFLVDSELDIENHKVAECFPTSSETETGKCQSSAELDSVDINTDLKGRFYGNCFWDRTCAIWLYNHRWFNSKDEDNDVEHPLHMNGLEIVSVFGLRVAVLVNQSQVAVHRWEFQEGLQPKRHLLDESEICKFKDVATEEMSLLAMDVHGNVLKSKLKCLP